MHGWRVGGPLGSVRNPPNLANGVTNNKLLRLVLTLLLVGGEGGRGSSGYGMSSVEMNQFRGKRRQTGVFRRSS